jgi:hypothetical protein
LTTQTHEQGVDTPPEVWSELDRLHAYAVGILEGCGTVPPGTMLAAFRRTHQDSEGSTFADVLDTYADPSTRILPFVAAALAGYVINDAIDEYYAHREAMAKAQGGQ